MANFEIKNPPEYSESLRKFEVTDKAHADLFNAVAELLINNDAFLKTVVDDYNKKHKTDKIIHVTADEREAWNAKAEKTAATTKANGLMSAADKEKLDGVAEGANKYVHPTTAGNKHIPTGGTSGQVLKWKANGEAQWAAEKTYAGATQADDGLMSAEDKKKLDGVASGANKYVHPTNSGNKHIPSGGSSGQILRWASDGTAQWGSDNNTTYSAFKGATSSAAGGSGLVPAPAAGKQAQYLRGDGTWATPTNTTYSNMTGASASGAGKAGLVPAPAAGNNDDFLRGDGKWGKPTKTDVGLGNVPNVTTDNQTPSFSQASSRANIVSKEKLSVIMGKIMKWFADLKAAAFCSVVNNGTTTASGTVLDGRMGKTLMDKINDVSEGVDELNGNIKSLITHKAYNSADIIVVGSQTSIQYDAKQLITVPEGYDFLCYDLYIGGAGWVNVELIQRGNGIFVFKNTTASNQTINFAIYATYIKKL